MSATSSARKVRAAGNETPLLRENEGNIAVLTLDRPQARNTLSEATLAAMRAELAAIFEESRIRAVVIAANGPVFSAGHDLKELTAHRADADGGRAYTREDDAWQDRWHGLKHAYWQEPWFARIGRDFLQRHRDLMPQ